MEEKNIKNKVANTSHKYMWTSSSICVGF